MKEKRKLGKGLSALISSENIENGSFIPDLEISKIKPNPYQPRIEIKPESILELADSIRQHGVLQPVIVKKKNDKEYYLIVGERRLRASKIAGLKTIPAVVKDSSPKDMLQIAIVENIQRADLNPIEEALAFKQLSESHKMKNNEIAKGVGLSESAVANKMRLLALPKIVKEGLLEGKTTEGHARALLGLKQEESIISAYTKIVAEKLSVRETEELVRRLTLNNNKKTVKSSIKTDKITLKLETLLRKKLKTKVRIFKSKRGGKIIIPFKKDDELMLYYKKLSL